MYFNVKANQTLFSLDLDLFNPERPERVGPCWLLKRMWMGTQRKQMKGVLSWLFRWACRAYTGDFFLPWLHYIHSRPSTKDLFPNFALFQFLCPHRPQQVGQAVVLGRLCLKGTRPPALHLQCKLSKMFCSLHLIEKTMDQITNRLQS